MQDLRTVTIVPRIFSWSFDAPTFSVPASLTSSRRELFSPSRNSKSFIRICECIADQGPILHQAKRNHHVILTKLPLQIDLLARLNHAN